MLKNEINSAPVESRRRTQSHQAAQSKEGRSLIESKASTIYVLFPNRYGLLLGKLPLI